MVSCVELVSNILLLEKMVQFNNTERRRFKGEYEWAEPEQLKQEDCGCRARTTVHQSQSSDL